MSATNSGGDAIVDSGGTVMPPDPVVSSGGFDVTTANTAYDGPVESGTAYQPPIVAKPIAPTGPDPRLHPDHDWGTDSEIGIAVAHLKAWYQRAIERNSVVPDPE